MTIVLNVDFNKMMHGIFVRHVQKNEFMRKIIIGCQTVSFLNLHLTYITLKYFKNNFISLSDYCYKIITNQFCQ